MAAQRRMFNVTNIGVSDDAPTQSLRNVKQLPPQPWPQPPVHNDYIAPTIHSHHFRDGPGKRGRTIQLILSYNHARAFSISAMTWDVNVVAIGRLAPGSRIRPMSISLGRAAAANVTQNYLFEGISVRDGHFPDCNVMPLQVSLWGLQTRDFSGSSARPQEIANLDCLVGNTVTARIAPGSNGSIADIRPTSGAAFQAVFVIEEPDIEE